MNHSQTEARVLWISDHSHISIMSWMKNLNDLINKKPVAKRETFSYTTKWKRQRQSETERDREKQRDGKEGRAERKELKKETEIKKEGEGNRDRGSTQTHRKTDRQTDGSLWHWRYTWKGDRTTHRLSLLQRPTDRNSTGGGVNGKIDEFDFCFSEINIRIFPCVSAKLISEFSMSKALRYSRFPAPSPPPNWGDWSENL